MKTTLPVLVLLCLGTAPVAHADDWKLSGDIRAAWVSSETVARNGAVTDAEDFRARLRLAWRGRVSPSLTGGVRVVGLFAGDQTGTRFFLEPSNRAATGIGLGDVTLDELFLLYDPGGEWTLKMGRFQVAFELDGVAKKSLDRNDSPNMEVTWTDGLHLVHRGIEGWDAHLILQHNHRKGPTNTLRAPLVFDAGASRVGMFAGFSANRPAGPVVQRMLGITLIRDALARDGIALPAREDYLALTAKVAAAWPAGETRRLMLAAEVGHAFNIQTGARGGLAWQASVNLYEILPAHQVGLVYGWVDDGWLLSGDFRPNEDLIELRWLWRVSPRMGVDTRWRRRDELFAPPGRTRRVDDVYLRATLRF